MGRSLLCLLVAGCSAATGSDLVIDRVDPASATNTAVVPLRVEGSGFHLPLTSDLDQGSTVVGDMAVTIGDIPLEAAVWRGEQLIEGSVPAGLAAGSYDVTVMLGDRSGVLADGFEVLGDVTTTCVAGFFDVCMQPTPTTPLDISTADTIDTDTDPRCRTVTQANGGPVCLVYATAVNIGAMGSLTATGSRPLAIVSTSTMTIAGTIDVSSRRSGQVGPGADDGACTFATVPQPDLGGAGGGAGGSFGALGGDGGTGDTDMNIGGDGSAGPGRAGPIVTITTLRGGCRGQPGSNQSAGTGLGGSSGGALYLYAAESIDLALNGQIRATGAGGVGGEAVPDSGGGGGGGSGGLTVIESPSITVIGEISANGGGGGEGGARMGFAQTPVPGQPGTDAGYGTMPAAGGNGMPPGNGGAGGAGTTTAVMGASSVAGGSGGGGGVGIIRLLGTSSVTGVVSPPPS